MIKYTNEDKTLVIPKSLGNFPQESTEGGMTPEQVEEMIDEAVDPIDERLVTVENEVETIQETLDAREPYTFDIATVAEMPVEDRVQFFTEISDIIAEGRPVYATGHVAGTNPRETVTLPVVISGEDYVQFGGVRANNRFDFYTINADGSVNADFADTPNAFSAYGRPMYELPIATANALGGVRVGAGLSIDANGVLSATGGGSDDTLYAVIAHRGGEEDPFDQNDLDSLQTIADVLSGVTTGDTVPKAVIDYNGGQGLDFQRFYLSVMWENESVVFANFVNPGTDGCWSYFDLNTDDVSASEYSDGCVPNTPSMDAVLDHGEHIATFHSDDGDVEIYAPQGGGGDSQYIVVAELNDIVEPQEGMMATVEGYEDDKPYDYSYFIDYNSFTGSGDSYGWIYSDDAGRNIKELVWNDNDKRFEDVENDGLWHKTNWEGYEVTYRVIVDQNSPEDAQFQFLTNDGDLSFSSGSYDVGDGSDAYTEFIPAKTYTYTGGDWYQVGCIISWEDIKDNDPYNDNEPLCDRIKMLAKTGIPVWFKAEGADVAGQSGITCLLPFESISADWINFSGFGTQYGLGRFQHLYISFTLVSDQGFNEHGFRFDNNELVNIPGTACMYVDPNGDMGHRSAWDLFDESIQGRLTVKGCELDFSKEYGFGSVIYARRWKDQNDQEHYEWSMIVPTDTGVKKGVWKTDDPGDSSQYVLDSWTNL